MTLKDFAEKYNLDANELLQILVFENLPISDIEDEIDSSIETYLLDYTDKGIKKSKKIVKKVGEAKVFIPRKSFNKKNKKEDVEKFQPKLFLEAASIGKCSKDSGLSASQFITYFLTHGKLYSINTVLSVEEIEQIGKEQNIPLIKPEENKESRVEREVSSKQDNLEYIKRAPVVVVVGHVDHGKTSLLDNIRKKSVAKGEKGGITQHIGAYEISHKGQEITFIDTPGHAAFTSLRSRGISVADVSLLIVASDDGVMSQTIESIKMIKSMGTSTIVVLTKADKPNVLPRDKIYQQLTENDIVPEDWGGTVPCVSVSSITGEGINDLLDVINLLTEIMDLKAVKNVEASGYVLESKIVKGFGPVATVILQNGILKTGEYFYVSDVFGKVSSIVDTSGKNIREVIPGKPFILSGAESICPVGEQLKVSDIKNAKNMAKENRIKKISDAHSQTKGNNSNVEKSRLFNIVLKVDTYSSLQAAKQSISELAEETFYFPNIIEAGIGNISESDVMTALNSKSIIYAFNVKMEPNIAALVEEYKIKVEFYDVIYHMLESIKEKTEKEKEPEKILKKTGELTILKIFNIKNVGTVIGFRVSSGVVKNGAIVKIFRGTEKIGDAKITSLQKEREFVKELKKGHEGAASAEGFNEWKEDDRLDVFTMEDNN